LTNQAVFHVLLGVFIVLHGLIHLVYAGHSARLWEAKPRTEWPDGSWACSRRFGDRATRRVAAGVLLLLAAAFGVGGGGTISDQSWWRPMVVGAAALSVALFCLLWNGSRRNLDGQGAIGLLISVVLLVAVVVQGGR
jgi:hypothetical protein